MRFSKIKMQKKKKTMDQFLTLQRANIGPAFNFTAKMITYEKFLLKMFFFC